MHLIQACTSYITLTTFHHQRLYLNDVGQRKSEEVLRAHACVRAHITSLEYETTWVNNLCIFPKADKCDFRVFVDALKK